MDEETYKALLERIDNLEKRISNTDKKVEDVTSFNRALLNRSEPTGKQGSDKARKEELAKKLKEALH